MLDRGEQVRQDRRGRRSILCPCVATLYVLHPYPLFLLLLLTWNDPPPHTHTPPARPSYNPTGVHLPPSRSKLEGDYKRKLREQYNIEFDSLVAITNMPINRFHDHLKVRSAIAHNPATPRGTPRRLDSSV